MVAASALHRLLMGLAALAAALCLGLLPAFVLSLLAGDLPGGAAGASLAPLLAGSLGLSLGAMALAGPAGLALAAWLVAGASPGARRLGLGAAELGAVTPSVAVGLLALGPEPGAALAVPLLAALALPTVVLLGARALVALPDGPIRAALALGATRAQCMLRVELPMAATGLLGAVVLGLGRVVGEAVVVLMAFGGQAPTLAAALARGPGAPGSPERGAAMAAALALVALGVLVNLVGELLSAPRARA